MEIGNPGEQRDRLLALVLAGTKVATTGLLEEWREGHRRHWREVEITDETPMVCLGLRLLRQT